MKSKGFIVGIMMGIFVIVLFALLCFSLPLSGLRSDWVLQAQGASFETASVFHQTGLALTVPTTGCMPFISPTGSSVIRTARPCCPAERLPKPPGQPGLPFHCLSR